MADWNRDFDDNTPQGLIEFDPQLVCGVDEFSAQGTNQNLRMQFHGMPVTPPCPGPTNNSGFMYDPEVFGDVSARMLIRYSNNPVLLETRYDTVINAGIMLRFDVSTISGYLLVMNDFGFLQTWNIAGGVPYEICPEGFVQDITPFSSTQDWWMRFESIENVDGSLTLRGRVWPDGTPEPLCHWDVQCLVTSGIHPPGPVGLLANEDDLGDGQFIDLDNASASSQLTCWEYCDNGIDDDFDGDADCLDSDCADHGECRCHDPFADLDDDGDVDQVDFARWQRCYTGENVTLTDSQCACLDRDDMNGSEAYELAFDGDGDIDADDLDAFLLCVSGPMIPANPACDE